MSFQAPQYLRFSEHPLSKKWLGQFCAEKDRNLAAQLVNKIKLVSLREFESSIEQELTRLQKKLNARLAVYPITTPAPNEIAGYDLFTGGIAKNEEPGGREVGRRRKYGSEDRVGHCLVKLQNQFKRDNDISIIECVPTLTQLKTQGIKHIVLVDDVCGSGKRLADFWKTIPRHIKSQLSYKKYHLWIILYTITPMGKKAIKLAMPNFPMTNLITVMPEVKLQDVFSADVIDLCERYSQRIGMGESGLGYKGSACPIVFEHGCPNNAPAILWAKNKHWDGLFPNRSIPNDLSSLFDENNLVRTTEALWDANQPRLALSLLDALDNAAPLSVEQRNILTLLGLRVKGVQESNLAKYLLMSMQEVQQLLSTAETLELYDKLTGEVTLLGKTLLERLRKSASHGSKDKLGKEPQSYYPAQCGGEIP